MVESFQTGVDLWMEVCFGPQIKADQTERADRFVEEALELVQTMHGFNAQRAHALVDYVFSRPAGEQVQEVGGVMVTLAALCNTAGIDMVLAGERELSRVWMKVEAIRAKQAAKPSGSALPIAVPADDGKIESHRLTVICTHLLEALEGWQNLHSDMSAAGADEGKLPDGLIEGFASDLAPLIGQTEIAIAMAKGDITFIPQAEVPY